MVLNMLRIPDIGPRYIIEKSFYQFQVYSSMPSKLQSKNYLNFN